MARTYDELDDELIAWIARQHVFFVATAPFEGGHVNLSAKGYDTFRLIDERTVAYLDLTGSGVETISHLADDGRLTIMFCAFDGKPRILRLYGRGTVVPVGAAGFAESAAPFPAIAGVRSVIRLDIERISTACGYAVPRLSYEGERETLVEWAERRGPDGMRQFWGDRNTASIDGLPGLISAGGEPGEPG